MTSAAPVPHRLDREARLMLQAAMLIFVWTIGIGILNGLDIVEFSRRQLLSHLHGGTLGWLTLGILSFTVWLFGAGDSDETTKRLVRTLGVLAVAGIAFYVFAFATTAGNVRPIAGSVTLAALVGFAIWALSRVRRVTLSVPRLLVLVGLLTSVLGGAFGVLNGLRIANDWDWVPDPLLDAHPGTMEIGFVLPVAMGVAEWGLRRGNLEQRASIAGILQVSLMLIAFLMVLSFILAEMEDLIGLGTMVAVVGVVIFWARMWIIARSTSIFTRGAERHALMGGVLLGVTLVYITVIISRHQGDFDAIPRGQVLAFIHLMAVGTTTNTLLAYVLRLVSRWSPLQLVDDLVFWGVNVGLIGFATVLTLDVRQGIHAFVPIMGAALLLAIAVNFVRLMGEGRANRS